MSSRRAHVFKRCRRPATTKCFVCAGICSLNTKQEFLCRLIILSGKARDSGRCQPPATTWKNIYCVQEFSIVKAAGIWLVMSSTKNCALCKDQLSTGKYYSCFHHVPALATFFSQATSRHTIAAVISTEKFFSWSCPSCKIEFISERSVYESGQSEFSLSDLYSE